MEPFYNTSVGFTRMYSENTAGMPQNQGNNFHQVGVHLLCPWHTIFRFLSYYIGFIRLFLKPRQQSERFPHVRKVGK